MEGHSMRVLIAYDGSRGAEQALDLAAGLRWPAESTLRVVAVVEPTLAYYGPPPRVPAPAIDTR
jgi:hypothetical protein